MVLSIADIDNWDPESVRSVAAASTARAVAASDASSRLKTLSAFKSWTGAGADAAKSRTYKIADTLEEHSRIASTVATAANTAANEIREIKSQLAKLRATLGKFGILVDADSSRVVAPRNLSSQPEAKRQLLMTMASLGQQSLNHIRLAAELTDRHLTSALRSNGGHDDFDLDARFVRAQGVPGGELPAGVTDSGIDCANYITQLTQITTTFVTTFASQNCDNKA